MKKTLLMMLYILTVFTVFPGNVAYEYAGKTLIYSLDDGDKTAQVVNGRGYGFNVSGDVVIPSKIEAGEYVYKVTSIGGRAFYDCEEMTSVSIPESVTSIEDWAFWGCSGLTSVRIPDFVTSLSDDLFYNCTGL